MFILIVRGSGTVESDSLRLLELRRFFLRETETTKKNNKKINALTACHCYDNVSCHTKISNNRNCNMNDYCNRQAPLHLFQREWTTSHSFLTQPCWEGTRGYPWATRRALRCLELPVSGVNSNPNPAVRAFGQI